MNNDSNYFVPGFSGSAVSAGLKKNGEKDLALIFSQRPAVATGVFTTNTVKAAPVIITQKNIKRGFIRGIIINTGYANACTGEQGLKDALLTANLSATQLEIKEEEMAVASTGVIGSYLPVGLIKNALPNLIKNLSPNGFYSVADAMRTTDSFPKISYTQGHTNGKKYSILGLAKGAGMIMPNMATMLSFILTDINIEIESLLPIFRSAAENTFNRITVDGDTSTNDMVLIMANGFAGNKIPEGKELKEFESNLRETMGNLAYMIAKDGEGATKAIIIELNGAASQNEANIAARTVANSPLVKTAVFGEDPNWGRIMAALGRSGITMKEDMVQIWIEGVKIVEGGLMVGKDEEIEAAKKMKSKDITITINLNQGSCKERITTCDLTYDYIKINAGYRS
ncbi:MAG: bifunctional glutamate N-acetyltransferase/amino-acid acetyltransferase ArgJ [Deltaproteobacteria bacterium]|nr:bifunctional glutamate N-acetyltransferase/amino-acid acetyltransferase ArgJ [Deltaproteobacteria bacterium]